jgi:hypothetical protein
MSHPKRPESILIRYHQQTNIGFVAAISQEKYIDPVSGLIDGRVGRYHIV